MERINIHETAFVTSFFRSGNAELSRDKYAALWVTDPAKEHAERYIGEVSLKEPDAHCLRNRYFLDKISELNENEPLDVLLNFGCGFSMYPFLLPPSITYVEIDKSEVVNYKEARVKSWQKEGVLPERKTEYVAFDFTSSDYDTIFEELIKLTAHKRTFILLEGVLFFLNAGITTSLFHLFTKLQTSGSYLGSVSFRPALAQTPVFMRLIEYVEKGLNTGGTFNYHTVADAFYESLSRYRLLERKDSMMLADQLIADHQWDPTEVLIEQMYLLQKI